MSKHKVRKAVGKTLRNPLGAFALVTVPPLIATLSIVEVTVIDSPDNITGPNHEAALQKYDGLYKKLTEQKQKLSKLQGKFALADQSNPIEIAELQQEQNALQVKFNNNAKKLLNGIYQNGNISEEEALHYDQMLRDNIIDPTTLGYSDFGDAPERAYAYLRECRVENTGSIEKTTSCMATRGENLGDLALYLSMGLGFIFGASGINRRAQEFAKSKKFKDWEDGASKTPFRPAPPKH